MPNCVILVFLCIMATCSNDGEFSSALVLRIIYTSEGCSDWKPWRNDHVPVVIILLFTPWCCVMMHGMYKLKTITMVASLSKIMEQ